VTGSYVGHWGGFFEEEKRLQFCICSVSTVEVHANRPIISGFQHIK